MRTLTYFYAPWCSQCRVQGPIVDEIAKETETYVSKVDIGQEPEKSDQYEIMSLPTVIVWDQDGEELERFTGLTPKEDIIKALNI